MISGPHPIRDRIPFMAGYPAGGIGTLVVLLRLFATEKFRQRCLDAMESSTSKSSGKKRLRNDDEENREAEESSGKDETFSLENQLTFSDTVVALKIMRSQFPKGEKVSVHPFVLRSQLYSSVKDRTLVDREIESLRKEKVVRVFKLNTGPDDHAIMFTDDYLHQVDMALKGVKAKNSVDLAVFEWFKMYVLSANLDVSIEHHNLFSLLSAGGNVKDQHITLLIHAGLLTRQLANSEAYWFTIPNIGSLLKGISEGRKELMSFLNRRKYKEMLLAPLEKKRLRQSPLDVRFHIRDLIGSGHLRMVETPAGLLVQVVKD